MTGPDTGSPPSGPKALAAYDRGMAYLDTAYDRLMTRLGDGVARGDRVAQADANTSYADLRAAAAIRGLGLSPDDLDRNGLPVRAGLATIPQGARMHAFAANPYGHPDPGPHPQPSDPAAPPPPR